MKRLARGILLVLALTSLGCVRPTNPTVSAAEDFRSTVFDLIAKDEAQTKRLNSLRLGMSDAEVLAVAGTPERREGRTTANGRSLETWVYDGQLSQLGTLTFVNGRLEQILTSGEAPAAKSPPADDAD